MRIPDSTSFHRLYHGHDSSSFFRTFVSLQDEARFVWLDEQATQPFIVQQISPEHSMSVSLFTEKAKPEYITPKSKASVNHDWITGLLLLLFILTSWVFAYYRKRIGQVFRAAFSYRYMNQLQRDGDLSKETINAILSVSFIIMTAFMLFLSANHWLDFSLAGNDTVMLFSGLLVATAAWFFLRILFHRVTGSIFKTQVQAIEYTVNIFIINHITTLFIFPLLIIMVYTREEVFLYSSIILYCILYLYCMLRGSFIGASITKFSYIYLFLYLCTLEILPLLAIVKVIEMRFL